jgi:hypothetical protein
MNETWAELCTSSIAHKGSNLPLLRFGNAVIVSIPGSVGEGVRYGRESWLRRRRKEGSVGRET